MYFIIIFVIFFLSSPAFSASSYENTPIIVLSQRVTENETLLPISVYWYIPKFIDEHYLIVYASNNGRNRSFAFTIQSYTGFHDLPRETLTSDGILDEYCAVIYDEPTIMNISPNCPSKIQWMYDQRVELGPFSLSDIVIPGTHESAAYVISDPETWSELYAPWLFSQTKSIKTQLMEGIRYLDLKPGIIYVNERIVYFAAYGAAYLVPINDVVKQIKEFMNLSKDIVIVSFSGFPRGFNSDDDHLLFMSYLEFSFYNYTHSRESWTYTLNELWKSDKRLILCYDHILYKSSTYMWPPIAQYRSDAQTINQLYQQLNAIHQSHADDVTPYAVIVQFTFSMTPDRELAPNNDTDPRYLAKRLEKYIPTWYVERWSSLANIIVVDFYQTSGIVDIAMQLNRKRIPVPGAL